MEIMKSLRSRLYGKAVSYFVNALVDAEIEKELIYLVKHNKTKTEDKEVRERVKDIVRKTSLDRKDERLLVKAFTYKWSNGYANWWYSKIFVRLSGKKFPSDKDYYSEKFFNGPLDQLINIIFFYKSTIEKYANDNGFEISLNKDELKKEIRKVQSINIKINKETSKKIKTGNSDTWKLKKIIELSKESEYPGAFLQSAIITQLSAGKWDKVYSKLI